MRYLLTVLMILMQLLPVKAEHITGGEMYYEYLGRRGEMYEYKVTLKMYRNCGAVGAPLDPSVMIAVYDRTTGRMYNSYGPIAVAESMILDLKDAGPCIKNPPTVCYETGMYNITLLLPVSAGGYTIVHQRCCRINGINNVNNSGAYGGSYVADIPGTNIMASAPENNSAVFNAKDTVLVCAGYGFTYDFSASDKDGDELRYSFCAAYHGGGQGGPGAGSGPNSPAPNPPGGPPYSTISYRTPYSGSSPLGIDVKIDPQTGIITGRAPEEGMYVVTVCVEEVRNGIVIATQRKDIQIRSGDCEIASAELMDSYQSCDDLNFQFQHPLNDLIQTFNWEFGDPASGASNFSSLQNPAHSFSAPNDYQVKLVINRGGLCPDSGYTTVKVWPGFFPEFDNEGICITNDVKFIDRTTLNHGEVSGWQWSLGEAGQFANLQNPLIRYSTPGSKQIQLIVSSTKGCVDTLVKTVDIIDKPPIDLAFTDTLICVPDQLQLQATGSGIFNWTPTAGMLYANTGAPVVQPIADTRYTVTLNESGCINEASVLVRVVEEVSLSLTSDTTICLTDMAELYPVSNGLHYQWWGDGDFISDAASKNLQVIPQNEVNLYSVRASIGSCTKTATVNISTVPYPQVEAYGDTTICFDTPAFLSAVHDGASFSWSPAGTLSQSNTLNPVAYPRNSTNYIIRVTDTKGCPKPSYDTVLVNVLPKIQPWAINDTSVVVGQPLQLHATGGSFYEWLPSTGLNDPLIADPVAVYSTGIDTVNYTVNVYNEIGCYDTVQVKVVVFKTAPTVFVPSAFSPNGDGKNDLLRPIAVGVAEIKAFRIYNRWGELLFATTINGKGWDGRVNGIMQATNVYVWEVDAVGYDGSGIKLKGTTTLIQ